MPKGFALLLIVVSFGTALVFILLLATKAGLEHQLTISKQSNAIYLNTEADACLQEVLIFAQRNHEFPNQTVFNGRETCDVTFIPNGNEAEFTVSLTNSNQAITKTATIILDPFELVSVH
ncbi:hypothetical protein CO057_00035 [Candidatus Uhrbacteria bacterium CG_4_9_14_0_2_um_filter_41_50]|uniref:Uncharacterized protein n=1 Tax=Candidatus Uhrbacteria bacterium CG_4_9_14_0_2_um_filter_41_50 TaxID=1975031 RepID=A0A2M8EQG5_9BACT|nr:MAG: hypothetical protein CO086_02850 [Candidatus Uhrbacteria bacterium CG_4_9_14_0_8_um_filter_41_16]PJC24962.1 MAG: hypothetical protein CO057_00035 [Candidatus Uhrbacteria bacterium CG_4_9_14_0_2_um_filter_41_50]PJE74664.1 MAG: hypothetical protein COV03_04240 [Candidatus Uhrbacteria bacterium CG10_big_fil_rev_8_21_14_0_10_41_26]